jgi:hypothetical protein
MAAEVFYGDVTIAAGLCGLTAAELTADMQAIINGIINSEIRVDGFGKTEIIEYHTIKSANRTELMLKKYPVIDSSVEIIDDANDSTSEIMDTDNYRVDNETGIIQLLTNKCTTNSISHFTEGIHSVKVTYEHGFDTVPNNIAKLANLLLAKWGKVKSQNADADGLRSLSVGNYSESRDLSFMNVASEFDDEINKLIKSAKIKYLLE